MIKRVQSALLDSSVLTSDGYCRMTDRDMVIGGYRIPKGTPISLPPYCLHTDPANFEQPLRFWPERWTQPACHATLSPSKNTGSCVISITLLKGLVTIQSSVLIQTGCTITCWLL